MKQKLLLTITLWLALLGSAWTQSNNALHFDGNVDYVSCPAINPTQFTVEAWVYPTQLGRDQAVISTLYVDGNKGMELHIGSDNLPIITINSNGTFIDVKGTNTIAANTWTHLAATYNGTTVKLYVNGAEAKSENHSSYRNGTAQVNIGKRYNESAAYYYSGRIDEVRIWNTARNQTDIAAAKDNLLTGTEANLLAYYTFNQGTAGGSNTGITTLTDATANAKHGTLYSFNLTGSTSNWVEGYTPTPTLSATPTTLDLAGTVGSNGTVNITSNTDWTISGNPDWLHVSATTGSGNAAVTFTAISELQQPQRTATLTLVGTGIAEPITLTVNQTSDNALHFDGTNDYVQCPALNPEEMTIEAWVYLTETGREQVLLSTLNGTTQTGWELVIGTNNQPFARVGTSIGIRKIGLTVSPMEMNTWVHLALSVNNYNGYVFVILYIDGYDKFKVAIPSSTNAPGNNNLMLGCSADNGAPNRFFSGKMDEIGIWNKLRLKEHVYNNINIPLTGTEEGLLAYYKCNQGVAYANNSTVTTLTDATAAGNNGTLHGFALSGITSNWVERHATFKLTAQPAELTLPYTQGSSGTVAITSNTNWSIAGIPDWLQASQTAGSGTVSVTFTALSNNTTGAERTAELSLTGEGITQPVTITVTQEHYVPTLTVSKTELNLAYHNASSDIISITSNTDWQITNIPAWLQVSQTTGSGNASVTFTTKEWNTDAAPRSASLTLSGTGVSQPVTLTATQGGYVPIALSHSTVVLGGNVGNSQYITLTTNKAWQHDKNADWLTVTPGTGNGSAGITLSASIANTASQNRYVDVVFFTADYEQVTLTVYQAPSTATLSAIITKTDGTQYSADNAASLCHAIGNTPLQQVKGIEVTGGIFPAYEWQWLADNRSRLTALTRFTITEGVTEVSNTRQKFNLIFNSNIEQLSIYGITEILNGEFENFAALSTVSFPTATSIDVNAFKNCSVLKTADFPMATSTGNMAFYGCTSLSTANFPMAKSIGTSSFALCAVLSTANFPNVTSIGGGAFAGCTSLSTANFPIATSIIQTAFYDCKSLSFANFPMATSIGNSAFSGCTSLSNLVLGAMPPATIGTNVFGRCPASRNLGIANATGSELTAAYTAYKAAPDGNTTDNLWYGWTIESSTPRQTMSAAAVFADGGHTLSPVGLMPVGVTIPLLVVPATGYRMVPGTLAAHKTGDPSTTVPVINGAITMPVYDVTVTAAFELQPYAVIVSAVNGTVIASPNTQATMGAEVTLSIAPTAGYQYTPGTIKAHRTGDASAEITLTEQTNGTYTFTMPAHLVTVTAQFEALPQVLTVANVPNGTITATPSDNIFTDTNIDITVAPNTGYRYKENSLRAYKTGDESVAVGISTGVIIMPAFDVTVTAEFEGLPQTLTVATVANGTITATPNNGIVTDTEITLTTTPANGYKLKVNSLRAYKTGDESVVVAIVDGKIIMPAFAVTVTAEFEGLPQVLTVETVNNGTITATPNNGIVTGTEITLTTTPANGYKLVENSLRAYKTGDESVVVDIVNGKFTMPAYDVTVTAEFEGLPQVLTLETVANGTITATPSEGIVTDTEIALTATPDAGYKLVENSLRAYKTGDESVTVSIADGKFTMPAYDVTVTAQFEALPQVLTVEAGNNGIITATPSEGIVTDTEITLTTTPAAGYKLVENSLRAYKTGDESVVVEIADGKFTMPAFDVTVTAEFEALPQTLTVATVANGTITATPSEGIFTDTQITLSTNPADGYKLTENSLRAYKTGDESVTVSIVDGKFTMPAYDVTVTAQFEAMPQELTIATVANGTITATPSEGIVTGTEITLSTTPANGYKLVENSLRAYKTDDESVVVEIADGKFTMPAFDVTVTAEFEALPQTLTVATVANGTITATPSEGIVTDTEITLSTTPAAGYKLTENSLRAYKTGDESVTVSIVEGKFTMPAFNVTVTAEFEALPQVLTVATVANGTITATPSEGIVTDTEITLSSTPAAGYKLTENSLRAHKTGDESVTVSIVEGKFTMPAFNVTVTAEFEALPQVLTVATVANGTITATPSEGIVTDTEITLSSTPAAGYKLTENSLRAYKTGDESVTVSIVDGRFTMPAYDVTVTAEFELIPAATYSVTVASGITNGTLTVEPNTSVAAGAEVMLTATPSAGYRLKEGSLKAHKTGDESVTVTITHSKLAMPAYDVTVTCQFELITGIDDNNTATVSAYPNPFTDYLVIESEEQIRSVSFINLLGKTVQHTSIPETRISTQNLLPGIYLVKLDFAKGKPVVIRMVKQ